MLRVTTGPGTPALAILPYLDEQHPSSKASIWRAAHTVPSSPGYELPLPCPLHSLHMETFSLCNKDIFTLTKTFSLCKDAQSEGRLLTAHRKTKPAATASSLVAIPKQRAAALLESSFQTLVRMT